MKWLKTTLAQGMASLLLLRLKNSPPEDAIEPTMEVWFKTITFKKVWEQEQDQWRFEHAFMKLAQTCEWFPAPAQLLANLPARKEPKALPEPEITQEQRQKMALRVQKLKKQLGVHNVRTNQKTINSKNPHSKKSVKTG
ncbi:hypothetical protein [Phocoenobacter skyensis]|uniref:Uncharacterized protein n=1 Tax=Phocoenobacter skyensis TaxID=97481 RepID=A0ABT9JN24_9PAST|nr:hypothetical protein [Pasteurella skyensis]MDP8079537.1 hypothetical protein [Pasteurella skyensis]MDP8085409.1 hypothetical protein [Pasteurella skyensis]